MKLQTKLNLLILPFIIGSILFLGFGSYHLAEKGIQKAITDHLRTLIDSYVSEYVARPYEALAQNRLQDVPSFVNEYQNLAMEAAETYLEKRQGHIFILSPEGKLVFCSKNMSPQKAENRWADICRTFMDSVSSESAPAETGTLHNQIYVMQYFSPWNWVIVLAVPEKQAYTPLANIRKVTIALAAGTAACALVIIILSLNRFFVAPVSRLKNAASEITRHKEVGHIEVHSSDELGALARSMESMAAEIFDSEKRLLSWQAELEKKVAARTEELVKTNRTLQKEIEERKQVEKNLRLEKDRSQKYFETAEVIFLSLDNRGRIESINKKGCEILGYEHDELIGSDWFTQCLPKRIHDKVGIVFHKLMDGEIEGLEYVDGPVVTKDEKERLIRWHNTLLMDENNHIRGTLSAGEDITDVKQWEEQLRQAQKMEAIGTLAGGIAHDFNNILFPLMGFTEMLKDELPPESPYHEHVDEIFRASTRAKNLVKQILTFSRQAEQENKPTRIQHIVKETLKLLRSSIPSTISIKQNIDPDCGVVFIDPTKIHQIIMNLATNAYHAMEDTGGELEITLKEVTLNTVQEIFSTLPQGKYARLRVADTGNGIPKKIMDKIFDPYFTTKPSQKGTGLGLSIVQGIVRTGNGDIHIESDPGKGTTISVYLPVITQYDENKAAGESTEIPGGSEKILVVDDEEVIVRMEKQMLERLGYQVTTYTASFEALKAVRTEPDAFDLLITDMTMPNMTGIQLVQEIRTIRSDIPVIISTGFSDQINKEKCRAWGIQDYVLKPVVISEIAVKIRKVLDKYGQGQAGNSSGTP